jgi:hypothetical protein
VCLPCLPACLLGSPYTLSPAHNQSGPRGSGRITTRGEQRRRMGAYEKSGHRRLVQLWSPVSRDRLALRLRGRYGSESPEHVLSIAAVLSRCILAKFSKTRFKLPTFAASLTTWPFPHFARHLFHPIFRSQPTHTPPTSSIVDLHLGPSFDCCRPPSDSPSLWSYE